MLPKGIRYIQPKDDEIRRLKAEVQALGAGNEVLRVQLEAQCLELARLSQVPAQERSDISMFATPEQLLPYKNPFPSNEEMQAPGQVRVKAHRKHKSNVSCCGPGGIRGRKP